jgi:hypothetical protein
MTIYTHKTTTSLNKIFGISCELTEELSDQYCDELIKSYGWIPSSSQKGHLNNFYGQTHTDETKRILSEKAKGRDNRSGCKHSEESKKKMSASAKGRKDSEDTRKKKSEMRKGKTWSEETKKKMAESARKRWQLTKENTK